MTDWCMGARSEEHHATAWVRSLENRETERTGLALPEARKAVARRLGVPAGTLSSLRRGRIKGVRSWVEDRLRDGLIAALEAEMRKTANELENLRRRDPRVAAVEIDAIAAVLRATQARIDDLKA